MDSEPDQATQQQILQFMTTEHFTLQTARSATIAEANGRSNLFLNTVSSAVVALAFIGQVSAMGEAFFLFGIVLFPSLFFLGIVTFVRVLQTNIEDTIHARGINRIRHYYIELAPEVRKYFVHSIHDDVVGTAKDIGVVPSKWQHFMTSSGMVAVINSVIVGVFAAMLTRFTFSLPLLARISIGVAVFLLSVVAHNRYQTNKWTEWYNRLEVIFPSGPK